MVLLKKLYRSRRDKKILGICGGLSEMLNVDATLIRILLIVITVISSGAVIFVYLIAGLVIPKEPPMYNGFGPGPGPGPGPGGYGGYGGGHAGYGGSYGPQSGPYAGQPGGIGQQHPGSGAYPPGGGSQWDPRYGAKSEPVQDANFDSMMDDLEKKALRREIEELKSKIAKYEKGE